MRLPWNRSPQKLNELLGFTSRPAPAKAFESIAGVFGNEVANAARKMLLTSDARTELFRETLVELSSLLLSRYEDWTSLVKSDIDELIPDVVKATHWKLRIKGYADAGEATEKLAIDGMAALPLLKGIVNVFLNDTQKTMRKSLVQKYIQTSVDSEAVAQRALRCVIAYLRYNHRTRQTILVWNESYRLGLAERLTDVYLYEQLALYSYLFKGEPRALFLDEIRILLRKYVNSKVSGQGRDAIVKDIVQDIFEVFFQQKQSHSKNPEQFFIDKRLSSYFIGLEREKKIINKYRINYQKSADIQFDEDDLDIKDEDEFPEELISILNHCRKALNDDCQDIISKRMFGDYADSISLGAVAELLNIPYKTMEKRSPKCDQQLRECVIYNSKQKGFRL